MYWERNELAMYLSLKVTVSCSYVMKHLASDPDKMLLFSWYCMKGIIAQVSHTLLRRFWHMHFASHAVG